MLKIYKMPNGRKYQFDENSAPKEAVLVTKEKVAEVKTAPKPANKAKKTTTNKSKKAATK